MHPGNAVTNTKYRGLVAATWNAAIPSFDGPAM
jgi:hypothetical protein